MSVAPDILLNMKPAEISPAPRASQQKASSGNEDGAFSKVYAKEKRGQDQPIKKNDSAGKPATPANSKPEANDTASSASSDTPPAAEAATTVASPTASTTVAAGVAVDPLLLAQLPQALELNDELSAELEALISADEVDPAALAAFLHKLTPEQQSVVAQLSSQLADEQANLLQLPGLRLEQGLGKGEQSLQQAVQAQVQGTTPQAAVQHSAQPTTALASVMNLTPDADSPLDKVAFADVLGETSELVSEVTPEVKQDASSSRFAALTGLLGAQSTLNARGALPQVPGGAVAIQQPGSTEALVNKVMWLSSQNLKAAELHLEPAELGRLEVRINLDGKDQAQVTFTSPNASVREALESQVHRLREMLSSQGMNLVDVNVSGQSQRETAAQEHGQGRGDGQRQGGNGVGDDASVAVASAAAQTVMSRGQGLVDYYA
ncbi:flagellar hook-length control protein FliK [Atopomonas sediminilitoris]|uniref:flagellar hook-length control protein FliK n=1 Tax=Atopomonas sediminilitoris TaxID=2919919 RepID=UPI001F4E15A4|nr:flagellar hook-length control protein FliK [Atopomonas sediminilitoris]MCJ8167944.1 flagellar hook-length control protein FliK [Atopomonas sediminilitoris]